MVCIKQILRLNTGAIHQAQSAFSTVDAMFTRQLGAMNEYVFKTTYDFNSSGLVTEFALELGSRVEECHLGGIHIDTLDHQNYNPDKNLKQKNSKTIKT
eukprot:5682450-Amphidinium_carterae.1